MGALRSRWPLCGTLNLKCVMDDVKLCFRLFLSLDVMSGTTSSLLLPSPDLSVSLLLLLRVPGGGGFRMGRVKVEVCDADEAPASSGCGTFALSATSVKDRNLSK